MEGSSKNVTPQGSHRRKCVEQVSDVWPSALELNPEAVVFQTGTDPDDVGVGAAVNDHWLLDAISILSAASVGDGDVEEQVGQVLRRHASLNGTICPSCVSPVPAAVCVRVAASRQVSQ